MNDEQRQTDALVVGAGPAGLALAHALIERGVQTLCVAPNLEPWAPTYGAWVDELGGLDVPLEKVWPRARVSFPRREPIILNRAYAKIDSAELHRTWSAELQSQDAFVAGAVSSALFSGDFHEISLESGGSIRARQLFDASGHSPKFVRRNPTSPAYQTAFGVVTRRSPHPSSQETLGLMEWDNGLFSDKLMRTIAAFYYVMPLDGELSFREYTVLASRPLVSVDTLRGRLMEDMVSEEVDLADSERCVIPMGHSVPDLDQVVVGFGGAASMVHPATGYMVARMLQTAPAVADAYIATRDQPADARARALWETIWPDWRVRTHELYRFGLEALLTMSVEQTHGFFAAFFELPEELWRPYQSGTASPREVAAVMWEVFGRVDTGTRARLAAVGFGRHAAKLWRLVR